ncbi:polyribonucleotide nucleotidyltransferase [Candidatus Gracilibacteria bacterium]|nr:polyribonucleotide nucleotidyltransferase [Candidatus Gracilibacteria bacterium]
MHNISDKNATQITPLVRTCDIEGENISFETGKLGLLADGAVTISDENDNILLVTTGFKENGINEKASFFPLIVDWVEKFYATGKIAGSRFNKREARPSNNATLTARLIDRPIRPMFPKGIVNDTQVIGTVLSASGERDLGFWGITGASLTLMMAGTPFEGPVAGCKIALDFEGKYIFNPTIEQEDNAKLVLLTAGTVDAITMVEAEAKEASDEEMLKTLEKSHEIIKKICAFQSDYIEQYREEFGIIEAKVTYNNPDESLLEEVRTFLTEEKLEVLYNKGKHEFQTELDLLNIETEEYLLEKGHNIGGDEEDSIDSGDIEALVYKRVKEVMRKNILEHEKRLDGRKIDEVREVLSEVGLLPRAHGSGLFRRGITTALSVCTLAGPDDAEILDGMMPETEKRYMHHYNFPPYSVGDVRMMRGTGRREIGHGALAEKALIPMLPSEEEFPYVIRVVSETMSCNGSSSMASICGSTLALMNAGVPIKKPVAGVAMGMIYDEATGNYKILSDIQAQEDFLGDMDFKVGRTDEGITAMQLDVKIKGLSMQVFKEAFVQAKEATDYISTEMLKAQPEVAKELSPYAPLILSIMVPVDKISAVIGRGGENVQRMEAEYNLKISIADDGKTTITAESQENGDKVIEEIKQMLWEPEVGYKGTGIVEKIIDGVGAIVGFKGKSGMIHISKLSPKRVMNVEDIVKEGDSVDFEIIQVDLAKGRIGLQRIPTQAEINEHKAYLEKKEAERKERPSVKVEVKKKEG